MIHTKLRIPLTIKIINLKTPLFLMFELIEYSFKVSTVRAVWCEVFYKFEGMLVLYDFGVELCIADEIGVWHIPLVAKR